MMKKSLLFVGMLSFVVLTGCSWWTKKEEAQTSAADVEATTTATTEEANKEAAATVASIKVIESKEDFENALKTEKVLVVKFYADWCGACKEMEATFDDVAKTNAEKYDFATINIDKVKEVADAQEIKGVPTVMIFKNGKVLDKTMGKMSKEELEIKIKETWEEENNQ